MADESCVMVDGPWTHRFVTANGSRFHIAEQGGGPLVLMLHGFPEFWWAWHRHLPPLADAGFRAVAVDLRGYGATDKPPRGYDGFTLASDVAGLIRALGERHAIVVGAGLGGLIAWAAAALHPPLIRRLVILGAQHPMRFRFELPRLESYLEHVSDEYAGRYREAMLIPRAAACAIKPYQWAFRSLIGYRFVEAIRPPIVVPTLQLHGALDPITRPAIARGSGRYVSAEYEWRLLDGVGHFPHLETPDLVAGEVIRWGKA